MLEGRLGDIRLLDLLQLLTTTAKTGRLSVARRDDVAHVDVRDGRVLDVVVPAGGASSGDAVPDEPVVERLTDLLAWHEGRFHFEGPAVQPPVPDSPHTDPVFEEARARLRHWPQLVARLGGEQAVLHLACPTGAAPVTLSPDRWRLVTLVDGRRTVAGVVAAAGGGAFRTHRALVDLLDDGLVTTAAPPPLDARGLRTRVRPERLSGDDVAEVDIALIERLIHGVERL
ncbi:MAG TPA: DUF4388 domain-containing protein [Egicoccus sp.]|nr:DUF4388 domain-containing protein [Egicoccus sp.]HSK21864.1 DUF4388 domain-containing protein [Egicoccus sp.]